MKTYVMIVRFFKFNILQMSINVKLKKSVLCIKNMLLLTIHVKIAMITKYKILYMKVIALIEQNVQIERLTFKFNQTHVLVAV
jgi:hypothetical protein